MNTSIKLVRNILSLMVLLALSNYLLASSHREAPLISSDPLADNVDVYAFRSPDNPNMVTLIATYVPMQLPQGGPNYYNFGKNIRYEIHVDNDASKPGDEITYRFTFNIVNEDPTTFFNIRLGKQNQKATYTLERSIDRGVSYQTIIQNGIVPPNNIGDRSIKGGAGLNTTYDALFQGAITTASTGEKVFAGPTDDPFFVDLGGIFDLGDAPRQNGKSVDGLACYNVSAIAIQVPISTLKKVSAPAVPVNILDPDYVIGVWASASRKAITTLSATADPITSGDWVQVSRLGMPLTNEAVIPIGDKDFWNSITPYDEIAETTLDKYFYNPELALYMDDDLFGGAVPAFKSLRIQKNSLGAFDFTNGADGLYGLKGNPALAGTALDDAVFGTLLLPGPGMPRSVDLWPAFHTGVPNVIPYQLATGKNGNPLAAGKPFVNNFLPNGGDMLRLNMAVPPTPRDDPNFSSLGLIQAAAIGLTVAPFNTNKNLEFIPNMDGFPNGRRLEDDVTRIELQAVSGVVLAAVGLWYDDYDPATSASPVTQQLLNVLTYTTGVEKNDRAFTSSFPYLAQPSSGTGECSGEIKDDNVDDFDADYQVFVSSNTSGKVGVFNFNDADMSVSTTFDAKGNDADGIYYDKATDVVFQLDRTNNVIRAFSKVRENLDINLKPVLSATSISNFTNGREIAVNGDQMVVVQDADASNGNVDKLLVYKISPTAITFVKEYVTNLALWGIHLDGSTLYAVQDLSDKVLKYDNFLSLPAGAITPSQTIVIESMVRTHGITYYHKKDMMILTDVAAASSATDGSFTVIKNFTKKAEDNLITTAEQIIIEGPNSLLGNPVDIAYDDRSQNIYVAERAKDGGRVLGYAMPTQSGDNPPIYNEVFAGASAIYLGNLRPDTKVQPEITVFDPRFSNDFLVSARMNGGNEVPAVTTPAIGVATITFNSAYTQATLNATVSNLSSTVTGAHIHKGKAGTNGAVVFNFSSDIKVGRITKTFAVTRQDVADFIDGEFYLNVHTTINPGGEVRGQLALEASESFMATISGANEVPVVNTDGKGLASVIYTSNTNVLEINVLATDLTGPITGIHFHKGATGTNGAVVENLTTKLVGNTIMVKLQAGSYISDLRNGDLYINIHTAANPSGEIRGQLTAVKGLYFDSWMDGKQEAPAATNKTIGLSIGAISSSLDKMRIMTVVDNASGPITGAHIHKSPLGVSGGVVTNLSAGINGNSILNENIVVNADLLNDYLAGNLYINLHSTYFPNGEVRGQIYRVARDGYAYDLCQKQEVPSVTNAGNTSGSGMFAFNRDYEEIHMMAVVNAFSSAFQGAHIHNGAFGSNGAVVYNITDKFVGTGTFFYATSGFPMNLPSLIQSGNAYVNIHTANNPSGEVRGQIVKTPECPIETATVEVGKSTFELDVYPNPSSDVVKVRMSGDSALYFGSVLEISDIAGKIISTQRVQSSNVQINVSNWNSGIYLLKLSNKDFQKTIRVTKL